MGVPLPRGVCLQADDLRLAGAAIDRARTRCRLEEGQGQSHAVTMARFEIEEPGPLHTVVRGDGWAGDREEQPFARVTARLHFFAGSAAVRVELTLHNPRR